MLQAVKDYIKITWDHEDNYLLEVIERGKVYLKDLTGTEMEFKEEGAEYALLLDYCRYYYNNAIEFFEDNFKKEIVRLQYKEAIRVSKVVADER